MRSGHDNEYWTVAVGRHCDADTNEPQLVRSRNIRNNPGTVSQ